METIRQDYHDKGVEFIYVYKTLAHAEWDGYVTPVTLEERLAHVEEFKRTTGSEFRWIVDTMDNDLKKAMGRAPNSEWVVDPQGTIVRRRDWSNPDELRRDLGELVGPVDDPTTVDELGMPTQPHPKAAAQGVVERIDKPVRMRPLLVDHARTEGDHPFYAKLRAEADRGLIESGAGSLYLRFMMDPLYGVHWNNEVDPIKVRIDAPEGVEVSPSELVAPEVSKAKGDIDPREFLIDVSGAEEGDGLVLKARYFACTDSWCLPMEQEYRVVLRADRDAGFVINARMREQVEKFMQGGGSAEEGH